VTEKETTFEPGANTQVINLPGRESRWVPRRFRFRLPRPAATFTARAEELAELDRRWPALGSRPPAVQVLTGLAGVGKTQLAAAYAEAHMADYDLIAWVRAAADPLADLADLADQLRLTELEDTVEQRAERTVMALAAWDRPWLLVFDNVEDPEMLNRWCPATGSGRILVTARNRGLAPDFGRELYLDVFNLEEATKYLLARSRHSEAERAPAAAVATALGRLPLALAHAGAYCAAERGTSFTDYLARLHALPATEVERAPEVFYTKAVASTLATSIAEATRRAPLAADVLNLAAVLDSDAIPLELFNVLVPAEVHGGAADAQHRLNRTVAELRTFGLVDVADGQLAVHRLLQRVVRDQLRQAGDTRPICQAVVAVAAAFPADLAVPQSWPSARRLVAHAQVLARQPVAALADCSNHAISLMNRVVLYRLHAGDHTELATVALGAVHLATELLGSEHPDTLTARANLAAAYAFDGRIADAIALEERVVADGERLLGPEHPDTLTARGNLASSYRSVGRTAEAIALQELVLVGRDRLLGAEHPDTVRARSNLAASYWSAGRTAEAIALQERVLAESERLLGPEHPETLRAQGNLAGSYSSAGRTAEAVALQERVLADSERLLGPEHPDTLRALGNLALSYWSAGRTGEAIVIEERVLADRERLLGPEHPDTLRARGNLAGSYSSAGRTAEAIALQERVLADSERLLGPEHPDALTARANLASSYSSAGRVSDATALLEQALNDRERVLGREHPDTLTVRANLASSYWSAGRIGEAVALREQVLADSERLLGSEHPNTLSARFTLAQSYQAMGLNAGARALIAEVHASLERLPALDQPFTQVARPTRGESPAARLPPVLVPKPADRLK
jgi:tetratricopeptide (TPR) repeat protein